MKNVMRIILYITSACLSLSAGVKYFNGDTNDAFVALILAFVISNRADIMDKGKS